MLAASAGEEVNLLGARAFVESGALAGAGAVIVGEPTGGRVAVAHKGAMWLAITTSGRTAHGSMPDQGINAILRMQQVLERVQTMRLPRVPHPLLGASTLSINTIRGGAAVNVVPDRCRVDVDIRTVPGTDHEDIVAAIRSACGDLDFEVAVEVLMSAPAVETDAALPAVQTAVEIASRLRGQPETAGAVPYFTEASIYQSGLRVPSIICGPGEAELAHQPNEWVSIPAYLEAVTLLRGVRARVPRLARSRPDAAAPATTWRRGARAGRPGCRPPRGPPPPARTASCRPRTRRAGTPQESGCSRPTHRYTRRTTYREMATWL